MRKNPCSVSETRLRTIAAAGLGDEILEDGGMFHRAAVFIRQQVLLGDISDIGRLGILGIEMLERLILRRSHFRRYRIPPFLGIREFGIDVEDHTAKREYPVAHDLADIVFGVTLTHLYALSH